MNHHPFTLIHWFGPFSLDELLNDSSWGSQKGLYFMTGKLNSSKSEHTIQYLGISDQSYASRFKNHHKLPKVDYDLEIWLGQVVSTPYPSNNGAYYAYLKEPERLLTYYLQPELNEKNKTLQPRIGTIESHWFNTQEISRKRRVAVTKALPDIISWDGNLWRTAYFQSYEDE